MLQSARQLSHSEQLHVSRSPSDRTSRARLFTIKRQKPSLAQSSDAANSPELEDCLEQMHALPALSLGSM